MTALLVSVSGSSAPWLAEFLAEDRITDPLLFDEAVGEIEAAYEALGHRLGWRFLYTPRSTLSAETKLMLVGLNPAGSVYMESMASCEAGNAYNPRIATLASPIFQQHVCAMFKELAAALGDAESWPALMDQTLTANFCPFRSPSWPPKHKTKETIEFSYGLWERLCPALRPRVILGLGVYTAKVFTKLYTDLGYASTGAVTKIPTGWGKVSFAFRDLERGSNALTIVTVPHPSHFFIVGNPNFADVSQVFASEVTQRYCAD